MFDHHDVNHFKVGLDLIRGNVKGNEENLCNEDYLVVKVNNENEEM